MAYCALQMTVQQVQDARADNEWAQLHPYIGPIKVRPTQGHHGATTAHITTNEGQEVQSLVTPATKSGFNSSF